MDWKSKLTSRKFWLALATFVTGLLIYFGKDAEQADQITALIMSGGAVVAYIIGEGLIDAAGAGAVTHVTEYYPGGDIEHPPETEEETEA